MTPNLLAREVEALVGSPFRLHGRDPATGLDCLGLLSAAMARAGRPIALPTGYSLRITCLDAWMPDPLTCGLRPAKGRFVPGDVVLLQPSPVQFHLAIADRKLDWVHAHAGLRKVVRDAVLPSGTIIHHWRLTRAG